MTTHFKMIYASLLILILLQGQNIDADEALRENLLDILNKATDVVKKECLGISEGVNFGETLRNLKFNQGYVAEELQKMVGKKCLNNNNQTNYDNVMKQLNKLKSKWHLILLENPSSPVQLSDHCQEVTKALTKRVTKFAEKLEPCLELQERYLKEFILEGYKAYTEYFCGNVGVLMDLNQTDIDCNRKFLGRRETNPHRICYAKSGMFGGNPVNVTTFEEMCSDLDKIYFCYRQAFEQHCPDVRQLLEFHTKGIKKIQARCLDTPWNNITNAKI